jgi:hypothetical protein
MAKFLNYLDKMLNETSYEGVDKPGHAFDVKYAEKPKSGAKQDIGEVHINPYPSGEIEIRVYNHYNNDHARILIPKEQVVEFTKFAKKQLAKSKDAVTESVSSSYKGLNKKQMSMIKEYVLSHMDTYDIESIPNSREIEAINPHELFWQAADRYISDLNSETKNKDQW